MRIFFAFFVVFFTACAFKSSPEYIAKDYIKALNDENFKLAKSYIYVPASLNDELSPAEIEEELVKILKTKAEFIQKYELDFKKCKISHKEEFANSLKFELECQSKKTDQEKAKQVYSHSFLMLKLDGKYKIVKNAL